jgi:hypothetical protein
LILVRAREKRSKMNGFASHGLDEDAFAEKGNIVQAFDAFCKSPTLLEPDLLP